MMYADEVNPISEAEQNVIGSILRWPVSITEAASKLSEADFIYPFHRAVWAICKRMHADNVTFDRQVIASELRRSGNLEGDNETYFYGLYESVFTVHSLPHWTSKVQFHSARRSAIAHAEEVMSIVHNESVKTTEQLQLLIDKSAIDMHKYAKNALKTIEDNEDDFIANVYASDSRIPTGFEVFDEWASGIGRGWLYVLSGRSGMGKTAKAIQTAFNIAQRKSGKVLFWSQEMTLTQLMERVASSITGIPYGRIGAKRLTDQEKAEVVEAYKTTKGLPIYFDDSPSVTIDHVRAAATNFKHRYGDLDLIVVDYLTRMDIPQGKNQTNAKAVGDVAKKFKLLAREMNCPVMLLAQINREGAEGRPGAHHLKESGDIEQEADLIEILWKNEDMRHDKGEVVNSSIVKGRYTGTRDFVYLFRNTTQRFEHYNPEYRTTESGNKIIPNKNGGKRRYGP